MRYEWSDGFSLGLKEIDDQHRYFVSLLAELDDSTRRGEPRKKVLEVLEKLSDYARVHFTTEEAYFEKFDYPDGVVHKRAHRKLLSDLEDFSQRATDVWDLYPISFELLDFMEDWLVKHLNEMDRKFARQFKKGQSKPLTAKN